MLLPIPLHSPHASSFIPLVSVKRLSETSLCWGSHFARSIVFQERVLEFIGWQINILMILKTLTDRKTKD